MKVTLPRWLAIVVVAMVVTFYFASFWFHINIWLALGIILFAMLVNGLVATVEDELPGGFNNPRDEDK